MTVHHDWQSGQELAVTITCAVTTAKDVDICDVGPVADRVNTDALNALFAPETPVGTRAWEGRVEFTLDGYRVSADSDGRVVIRFGDS